MVMVRVRVYGKSDIWEKDCICNRDSIWDSIWDSGYTVRSTNRIEVEGRTADVARDVAIDCYRIVVIIATFTGVFIPTADILKEH